MSTPSSSTRQLTPIPTESRYDESPTDATICGTQGSQTRCGSGTRRELYAASDSSTAYNLLARCGSDAAKLKSGTIVWHIDSGSAVSALTRSTITPMPAKAPAPDPAAWRADLDAADEIFGPDDPADPFDPQTQ